MTDTDSAATANERFSPREIELLGYAMQSLKGGPPEIDYENLARLAKMTNPKSAANAWSKIKNKLMTADDGTVKTFPKAPKTPRGKAKLKADTEVKGEEGEATKATPKTPRKRAAKTDDNDASPKKRGRKAIKVQEEPVKDVEMGDSQEAAADADPEVKEEEVPEEPKQEEVGSDAEAQEEV